MVRREIKCVRKDVYNVVSLIKGDWGNLYSSEAIDHINNKKYGYFIVVDGQEVDVIVHKKYDKEFLSTSTNFFTDKLKDMVLCP